MMFEKNKKKVLIVEDDSDISEMYRIRITAGGFEVETAANGQIGIEKMKKFLPDLVLLDIVMPKKDGFDLLEEVRQASDKEEIKKIPIIVLSNLASPIDIMEGKRLGAQDWWIKAFNTPSQISQKVIDFFNKKTIKVKKE
ncbi:response regulator [Patescibacteria group bacterium]|nr:response regulator [Patescibacteria group bacterium]MBU4142024.1 response regulator [Patescibacteria group bacterium]MBU4337986.1 response regulator [Patescibacteria group bacterium]